MGESGISLRKNMYMKPIFNSLGSNYDWHFLVGSLKQILGISVIPEKKLREKIAHFWNANPNQVVLTYKGRDAIQVALAAFGIGQGDEVLSQAFSCFAIEEAIVRVGAQPVYVDVAPSSTNFSVLTLEKAFSKSSSAKAIIIQHSLGQPADSRAIIAWAKTKKLLVIEDVAQGLGGKDLENQVLGSSADAIVLSFGRDKMVDGVSGGAVLFHRAPKKTVPLSDRVPKKVVLKDLLYPLITWKVRVFYPLGLGKMIHWLAIMLKMIESPTKTLVDNFSSLPEKYIWGILYQFSQLEKELEHRREVAVFYRQNLVDTTRFQSLATQETIQFGSNLRYPIFVENPENLSQYLASKNIFLADRWYRSPVDSGRLNKKSCYRAESCPAAEKLSQKIFNLPTHKNISLNDAKRIVQAIHEWGKL